MAPTAACSPSKTASTIPSGRLRIHPVTPAFVASRRHDSRKNTPWTRPSTTTMARTTPTRWLVRDEERAGLLVQQLVARVRVRIDAHVNLGRLLRHYVGRHFQRDEARRCVADRVDLLGGVLHAAHAEHRQHLDVHVDAGADRQPPFPGVVDVCLDGPHHHRTGVRVDAQQLHRLRPRRAIYRDAGARLEVRHRGPGSLPVVTVRLADEVPLVNEGLLQGQHGVPVRAQLHRHGGSVPPAKAGGSACHPVFRAAVPASPWGSAGRGAAVTSPTRPILRIAGLLMTPPLPRSWTVGTPRSWQRYGRADPGEPFAPAKSRDNRGAVYARPLQAACPALTP